MVDCHGFPTGTLWYSNMVNGQMDIKPYRWFLPALDFHLIIYFGDFPIKITLNHYFFWFSHKTLHFCGDFPTTQNRDRGFPGWGWLRAWAPSCQRRAAGHPVFKKSDEHRDILVFMRYLCSICCCCFRCFQRSICLLIVEKSAPQFSRRHRVTATLILHSNVLRTDDCKELPVSRRSYTFSSCNSVWHSTQRVFSAGQVEGDVESKQFFFWQLSSGNLMVISTKL